MKIKLTLFSLIFMFNLTLFAQDEELCPPAGITVFGGNEENIISWGEPVGNIGCGDFAVNEMPFSHQGTNAGMGDDWPVAGSQGEDVAYTLNVTEATTYDFTLCSNYTDYDTKLEIFTNDQDCINPVSTGNYNDDDFTNCPDYVAPYPPSGLWAVTLQAGQYYVVVDGFGGATGNYEISISLTGGRNSSGYVNNSIKTVWPLEEIKMAELGVSQDEIDTYTADAMNPLRYTPSNASREIPEECGTFSCYRVYNAVDNTILTCTNDLSFTHGGLTNGTEYCYYITTLYDEGESEATETVCATPGTFDPLPPTNMYAEVWDEEVSLYWTAPEVNSLGVPYYESFDEGGLLDLWLVDGGDNWLYDEFTGNPLPCMRFNWSPSTQNYDQSLYAPVIPLGALTEATVAFDFEFSNFSPTGAEYLSIEYKTGSDVDWTVLEAFANTGDGFTFTTFSYDMTGLTENLFVRFHCYGTTTFDINWYLIDNFAVTSEGRESRNEYDFMGYNVYLDGVVNNDDVFDSTNYTVFNLSNELEYSFGVTAVYEGAEGEDNYESDPVTVTAQPVYVFGDVIGTVTDPNGATLDSVIVTSGSASDTTGTDGTYTLWNLDVGTNTVQVRRSGFYTTTEDVEVLAQADPTVQDFVLSPDMQLPVGLDALPLDEEVFLSWRTPGNGEEITIQYDDGVLANAFYFFNTYEDGNAHGIRFDVGGGFDVIAASIKILSEGDEFWPWPNNTHGPVRVLIFDDNNGFPGNLLHDEETIAEDGWATVYPDLTGLDGSVYVIATHTSNWTDPEGFGIDGGVDYPDNMVTLYYGEWNYGDYLGYGGDYMMAVQVLSFGGLRTLSSADNDASDIDYNSIQINPSLIASTSDLAPMHFSSEPTHPVFNRPIITPGNRDNELLEYRVYEVDLEGNETYVVSTTDTFTTVTASPNYLEYCYNVSAYWSTDDYGELESRHSNVACTVPYTLGDADFDSDCDISDVLVVVDFILEEDFPTEDEFRNVDVNMDEEINIADVILMIDIIFGGAGRSVEFDASEVAYIDLIPDYAHSRLSFEIEYSGPVRGFEFELEYDPALVKVHSPGLSNFQDHVMVSSKESGTGVLKILAADLQGGAIEGLDRSFITIPVEFIGHQYQVAPVSMEGIKLAGADGSLVNVVARTTTSDVKAIPGEFALQQNFPNPFNPSTEIRYDLPEEGFINLAIYNMVGQKVRTLRSETMQPGYHSMVWDGRNDVGSQVATGMYFYSIHTGSFQATKKMLFLK